MVFLIIICITLLWFFLDIAKYFISLSLEPDSIYIKRYKNTDKSKIIFFSISFVVALIKASLITIVLVLIYPFLDKNYFINFIIFYFLILSLKIIPDILFLFQRLNIARKTFVIEVVFSFVEYAIIAFLLNFLLY
ncbi:MAG: hypothetical protein LBF97_01075 [Elusimicrobiota bacterium]|nr:hypothetical protein [Elusimicrobiota bacterium]